MPAVLARYRSAHGDSADRFAPVSATTRPALSVFGTGDSELVGSGPEAISQGLRPRTYDCLFGLLAVAGLRTQHIHAGM